MESVLDYKKDVSTIDKQDMNIKTKPGQLCIKNDFGMEVIGSTEEQN